uniref:Uncharacterized protein n=1 Tax=Globodera rostochiensis TaxID=31243 RepID=A0A914I482_GLORO
MVHVPFDTRTVGYDDHIPQYGGGVVDDEFTDRTEDHLHHHRKNQINYFRGAPPYQRGYGGGGGALRIQRGAGIGDVLRGLWRILLPVVKRAGTAVGREALETGGRILDKVQQGENLKKATISEGKKSIDTLLEQSGLPKQFGGGVGSIKRGHKRVHFHPTTTTKSSTLSPLETHQTLIGRATSPKKAKQHNRRKKSDTFGFY